MVGTDRLNVPATDTFSHESRSNGVTRLLESPSWSGCSTTGGGWIFRAGENMNLQIQARQNLCHFLKMSEQIVYGSHNCS